MNETVINNQSVVAPVDAKDAAWASFMVPMPVTQVIEFCRDVIRLLRINPYLEFDKLQNYSEKTLLLQGKNLSQQPALEFDLLAEIVPLDNGVIIYYQSGLKTSTTIKAEAVDGGTKLTLVDNYDVIEETEREQRLHEVDKSLVKWAQDIQAYLLNWKRWSWLAPWRWYMKKVWQPMKPVARRITYILLWISVVEVALIMLGVAIYFTEYAS